MPDLTEPVTLTYQQAKNRLKDINDDIQRLDAKADKSETRNLNTEDQDYWDALVEEARAVAAHIGRLERESQKLEVHSLIAEQRATGPSSFGVRGSNDMDADPLGEPDSIAERRFKNPWDTSEVRYGLSPQARGQEIRARAFSAIEKMQGSTDHQRETATKIIEQWDNLRGDIAQMALATSDPDYLAAWVKQARSSGMAHLNANESAAVERAMSLTDAAGGFLVPFQLDPTVILTSDGSYNEIRKIARQVIATGDTWNGVSAGAVSWSFDAEAAEVSDDTPTFAQPVITIRQARGFVPISMEAYDDAANVTQEIGRLLAQGKDDLESVKFITGASGSNEPIGIVTALVASSPTVIATSATTDTFAVADVKALLGALPARYRSRASWLANDLIYSLVRGFDTQGGANLWTQLANDRPPILIGKNVYEAEAMDGTVTALGTNYNLIVGDFSNYVIADRIGMQVEFIPHLFATANNLPSGQRGWFARYRVGADSVNDGAFRMLNVT